MIEIKNISKSYSSTKALIDVKISIPNGEITSIYGPNGAGKSTLVKIICGEEKADKGEVTHNQVILNFNSYKEALNFGISYIPQDLGLIENMTVLENLAITYNSKRKKIVIVKQEMRKVFSKYDYYELVEPLLDLRLDSISVFEQQLVAIFKSLLLEFDLLILDESTTNLNKKDFVRFKEIIFALKSRGKTIIFISHKLDEVFDISDNVIILKNGNVAASERVQDIGKIDIINMFKSKTEFHRKMTSSITDELCQLTDLLPYLSSNNRNRLNKGEVLSIESDDTALNHEIAYHIFSSLQKNKNIKVGIVPASRDQEGIFSNLSIRDNLLMAGIGQSDFRNKEDVQYRIDLLSKDLKLEFRDWNQNITELSGGNRQKVILGRWILSDFDVLMLIEPTAGVDIQSKNIIHNHILKMQNEGKSFILTSTDEGELEKLTSRTVKLESKLPETC